jgi:hypothetical protein
MCEWRYAPGINQKLPHLLSKPAPNARIDRVGDPGDGLL